MATADITKRGVKSARQLGRYVTPRGARVLIARRNGDGLTFITDEPAKRSDGAPFDPYTVETVPDSDGDGAIDALVADYLEQARSSCSIPMARTILDAGLPVAA